MDEDEKGQEMQSGVDWINHGLWKQGDLFGLVAKRNTAKSKDF